MIGRLRVPVATVRGTLLPAVLLAALAGHLHAGAITLFTDLPTTGTLYESESFGVAGSGATGSTSFSRASSFVVSGTGDFLVSQIDLGILTQSGPDTFTASIWTDDSNQPGVELDSWNMTTPGDVSDCCSALATESGITGLTLTGGSTYYMVTEPEGLTDDSFNQWSANNQGVADDLLTSTDGGTTWTDNGSKTQPAFDVLGTAVTSSAPEPSTFLLVSAAFGIASVLRHRALKS